MHVPTFSICIPQYNRTRFLLRALDALRQQSFRDFEVCISDDCSDDGRTDELLEYLKRSGMSFSYHRAEQTGRYDRNLRSAISLARGRYCVLFGNDDMLADQACLAVIAHHLEAHGFPSVAITNYRELGTGLTFRRVGSTQVLGSGPLVAASNFRNFSFVSGVILDRVSAQHHATQKWDGSEMYQMYLGSRIIATGGRLLGIENVLVLKDIQIPGEIVDSYARKPVIQNCKVQERRIALSDYGRVAFDAVAPFLQSREKATVLRRIFSQVLLFTYPPWLVEYRRVQSWRYALGIALGMRPRNLLVGLEMDWWTRSYVRLLHVFITGAGLMIPRTVYEQVRPGLYAFAKRNS